MDIKALRYFVTLIQHQSFTRASEALFVTQPTISKMIRNLEQSLNQPLIQRDGRRFWLTDAGEIVYARALQVIDTMEQLNAELDDLNHLERGHLRLGIPPMVGHLYAGIIRRYKQLYPKVELTILEYGGRKIEQALINGEMDVAITMLPTHTDHAITFLPLDRYQIQAIVPNNAKWQNNNLVSWHDIRDEPFYMYTKDFTLSEYILQRCHQAGYTPQISARSSQWDFLVALVKNGSGITFLPQPLCHRILDTEVLVKTISTSMDWRLGLIWHSERYIPKTATAWIELCKQEKAIQTNKTPIL
ncbi:MULTISPECIES: LysR family transcriptional regulator [Vibrio]|uniref:LysR family transcriptional regulator n=1 Tax=Vibrio TaxID=662 RepID=UPI001866D93E|nr:MULTISPECIES: LysR family transcriptional regulator [Vibrio]